MRPRRWPRYNLQYVWPISAHVWNGPRSQRHQSDRCENIPIQFGHGRCRDDIELSHISYQQHQRSENSSIAGNAKYVCARSPEPGAMSLITFSFFAIESILDPTCWTIIMEERNTCCLIAREHELFKLRQGDSVCSIQNVTFEKDFKSIIALSISYNQKYLALYTNNGIIWMGSADLKSKYCEFETNRSERPRQIEWILDSENCRDSLAVLISYPSILLVVTIGGDSNMYSYDPAIFLIPEMDCVRILTNNYHEMIQKVPSCVNNIFAINSQKPSSWLFEAHKKYEVSVECVNPPVEFST